MKKNSTAKLMLNTGMMAGFTFNTGLLWGMDNRLDVVLPFVFLASVIFVAVNLALSKPSSTPPKCLSY